MKNHSGDPDIEDLKGRVKGYLEQFF